MKRMCREVATPSWRRQPPWAELFPHARIITDPRQLAQLYAEAERRKQRARAESQGAHRGSQEI